jgi:hypothetical protein
LDVVFILVDQPTFYKLQNLVIVGLVIDFNPVLSPDEEPLAVLFGFVDELTSLFESHSVSSHILVLHFYLKVLFFVYGVPNVVFRMHYVNHRVELIKLVVKNLIPFKANWL